MNDVRETILSGKASLGIELGSTRIKAVLVDENNLPVASGGFAWENRLEDGVWTYRLEDAVAGVQAAYSELCGDVLSKYGVAIEKLCAVGFSGMMHGYLAFDKEGRQLVPFRTWRNTMTEQAASDLTEIFQFNIPQRWSIAHLYQAILNNEPHVGDIAFLTTLSGYIHWRLTGEKVLGVGEASGMFPIDSSKNAFNTDMERSFDELVANKNYPWRIKEILPKVLSAGSFAGTLTAEGAGLLDTSGKLTSGAPLCPPEGDAGTGMVATDSVAVRTGNVSAGTSIFAMVVLEKPLSTVYREIDMVTTPDGKDVAMVHCNNCTSDLDAWVKLFSEVNQTFGNKVKISDLYDTLYKKALEGDTDCGGVLSYNYYSGEQITDFAEGRPLLVRTPSSSFSLANFMRSILFSTLTTLKLGMDILFDKEKVKLDKLLGHGGLFKTQGVGQQLMAAALDTPVCVMETAGEGGAWGIAILAAYMAKKDSNETLPEYLTSKVFAKQASKQISPYSTDVQGFLQYLSQYKKGLSIERAAVEVLR